MTRALHAEWTKLRTVPSTAWLLLATVACTVLLGSAATGSVDTSDCPSPAECFEDTVRLSLTGVWLGQVAVVVLAALAMTTEYGTGLIGATLAAHPCRPRVLLTKAAVVTAAVSAAGALGVLGSLAVGRFLLPGNGFTVANGYQPLSLADGPTLRAAVGTVLYLGLIALLVMGVGTIARDTAAAITTVLTVLYLFPVITELVSDERWHDRLEKYAPMKAGLTVQATTGLDRLPIGPWTGLGVLACYAGGALLAGAIVFARRDAS